MPGIRIQGTPRSSLSAEQQASLGIGNPNGGWDSAFQSRFGYAPNDPKIDPRRLAQDQSAFYAQMQTRSGGAPDTRLYQELLNSQARIVNMFQQMAGQRQFTLPGMSVGGAPGSASSTSTSMTIFQDMDKQLHRLVELLSKNLGAGGAPGGSSGGGFGGGSPPGAWFGGGGYGGGGFGGGFGGGAGPALTGPKIINGSLAGGGGGGWWGGMGQGAAPSTGGNPNSANNKRGGPAYIPFIADWGLGQVADYAGGAIGSLLGPEGAAIARGVAKIGEEAVVWPQSFYAAQRAGVATAGEYFNPLSTLYGMSVANGGSVAALESKFYGPGSKWRKYYGLTSAEAINSVAGLGFDMGDPDSQVKTAEMLAAASPGRFSASYAGLQRLPQGMISDMYRSAVIGGAAEPGSAGLAAFLHSANQWLSPAVKQGLDSSTVMRSVDENIAQSVHGGGLGVTEEVAQRWVSQFTGGMHGAQNGQYASVMSANLNQAWSKVGVDPQQTIIANTASRNIFSDTTKALAFLHKYTGKDFSKDPDTMGVLNQVANAYKTGREGIALQLLKPLLDDNDPARLGLISEGVNIVFPNMPADMRLAVRQNATSTPAVKLLQADRMRYIQDSFDQLRGYGYTVAGANAVIAAGLAETWNGSFNPLEREHGGPGVGLFQITGQGNRGAYRKMFGREVDDPYYDTHPDEARHDQIQFYNEVYGKYHMNQPSPGIMSGFEKPASSKLAEDTSRALGFEYVLNAGQIATGAPVGPRVTPMSDADTDIRKVAGTYLDEKSLEGDLSKGAGLNALNLTSVADSALYPLLQNVSGFLGAAANSLLNAQKALSGAGSSEVTGPLAMKLKVAEGQSNNARNAGANQGLHN